MLQVITYMNQDHIDIMKGNKSGKYPIAKYGISLLSSIATNLKIFVNNESSTIFLLVDFVQRKYKLISKNYINGKLLLSV